MTDDNATRDVATETGPGNDETGATTTREAALAADASVEQAWDGIEMSAAIW